MGDVKIKPGYKYNWYQNLPAGKIQLNEAPP